MSTEPMPPAAFEPGLPAAPRGRVLRWALAVGLAFGLWPACGPPGGGQQIGHGVLVIAVDGLRADHLSAFGYDRQTSPTIDRLIEEGVSLGQAMAAAPLVMPSHVSLVTGCHPWVARRFIPAEWTASDERRWRIPRAVPHLAVEFLGAGYATAAFVDNPLLAPVSGFDPGFQEFVQSAESDPPRRSEIGAGILTHRMLQWLRELDRGRSWFAYMHLADLEYGWRYPDSQWDNYFEPRETLSQVPPVGNTDALFFAIPQSRWRGGSRSLGAYEAIYDGHIRRLDEDLGRLIGSLQVERRFENTTIVLVGSFGIQFGEAGLMLQSGGYSMADLHVPWVIRPGAQMQGLEPGSTVSSLASLVDVAPTLLDLCGLPVPRGMHGRSLAPELLGAEGSEEERGFVYASCGLLEGGAVISDQYCFEFLLPDRLEDEIMRRSWFGELEPLDPEKSVRFYDRKRFPHPPMLERRLGPPAERDRHRTAAREWLDGMMSTRHVLQGEFFLEPLAPEEIQRLQDEGLIIDNL